MRLNVRIFGASAVALLVAGAASAASVDGKWTGNLRCEAAPQNPSKLPAFSNPISMVVANNAANMTRNTDAVTESLSGTIHGAGTTSLSGNGRFKAKEGTWVTKIDGKFSGNTFSGTGTIYRDDGGKVRDCVAELTIEAAPPPKVAKAPEPMPAVNAARPPAASEAQAVTPPVPSAPSATLPVPAKAETDPPASQIDAKSFIGTNALLQETLWSSPKVQVFGKRTVDWTDQDFQLLDQKLRDQIVIERNVAVDYNRRVGLKSSPDENSLFKVSRQDLQNAISAIPQLKSWVDSSRQKGQADDAQRLAQERSRQVEEVNRRQQASTGAAQSEASSQKNPSMGQLVADKQAENARGTNLQIFLWILAVAVGGWAWNKFVRYRCPNCKSAQYEIVNTTVLDTKRGTAKVVERRGNREVTRNVRTTYGTVQYDFCCKTCQHKWVEQRVRDLERRNDLHNVVHWLAGDFFSPDLP